MNDYIKSDFEPDDDPGPDFSAGLTWIPDPPSIPITRMLPLLDYMTCRLQARDWHNITVKRSLFKPLWLMEDYFDIHILHNFHLEYDEMDPKIAHLIKSKIKAYEAWPFQFKDFVNENMRVLYWIWLFYFTK
jgi:hypothetical protein